MLGCRHVCLEAFKERLPIVANPQHLSLLLCLALGDTSKLVGVSPAVGISKMTKPAHYEVEKGVQDCPVLMLPF